MGPLYTFVIYIYQLLLKLASLWHPKAKALVLGRKEIWGILQKLQNTRNKRYWFLRITRRIRYGAAFDSGLPLRKPST